ncbi:hypothetical protein BK026_05965 [Alteromonas sp. V450]|uniref:winged helix-turn-helix domain-containing protein n=1 Tax=Alteromonas sp. V450 TaxID=1912139 RepID=UPI0008FF1C6D|nr:winged helix-turn-helix domain-containing protein [Alteromonas sp. V450]OJF68369.1 hypothetical protein BK026_05965 [Alteromonas sp. V450]
MQDSLHFQFGDFSLDMGNTRLIRDGVVVSNDDKIVKALNLLCEHYPEAVDKDLMLETLWPSQVVTDWSVSKLISEIRQVLGDNGKDQGYIKTVRGKGFRMNTPVSQASPQIEVTPKVPPATTNTTSRTKTKQPPAKIFKWVASVGVIAILFVAAFAHFYLDPQQGMANANNPERIAVLPVASQADSNVHNWVEYGVMALVAEQLSQYPSIQIIPVDRVVALVPDSTTATFDDVCGQLGCSKMVAMTFSLDNNQPQIQFVLTDEKGESLSIPFVGVDVIDSANKMLEVLAANLIPRDQDIIPLANTFSSNEKANRDYAIGVHELFSGELKDARNYLNMALEKEPEFFWAKAYLADLTYRTGELEQSSAFVEELEMIELTDAQAFFIRNIQSNILYSEGKLNDSLAITLALQVNPFVMKDPLIMGNQFLNSGSSMQALGRLDDAIPQLVKAREYYQAAGYGSGEGKVLFNLGNVYLSQMDLESAVDHYQQAKDVFIRYGLTGYALFARHQIATTNLQRGDVLNVENELKLLIQAYQGNGDMEGEMTAYNDLALVSMVQENYEQAAQRAEEALENLAKTELSYLKNHAIHLGAKAYLMLGNAGKAEALLTQLEGEWSDQRSGYVFINAHLTLVKGDAALALAQAYSLKEKMAESWTPEHEKVLEQFKLAATEDDAKAQPIQY